mgnify:CR=1 FL=1
MDEVTNLQTADQLFKLDMATIRKNARQSVEDGAATAMKPTAKRSSAT